MKHHVRRECDPKTPNNSGSLCGLLPRLTQAGYNPESDLVYRLDTLQAIRQQDICSACLRAIGALKNKRKRAFAGRGQHQEAGGKIIHGAPHTTSLRKTRSARNRSSVPPPASYSGGVGGDRP